MQLCSIPEWKIKYVLITYYYNKRSCKLQQKVKQNFRTDTIIITLFFV